ncbi:MAG: hypothetical protein AAFQ92_14820, partial [Bacteroidota bacterium]
MLILSQQIYRPKSSQIIADFIRPAIADNSAYVPMTPIWGYTPDGTSNRINTRIERRLSGFQNDAFGGNCGIKLSNRRSALGGGDTWEVWMNLQNSAGYRSEFEALESAWQPNYRIKDDITVPIDYTMHSCATVSMPTDHVKGITTASGTLQEDGPQHLIMQVHPHDDNVAGDGDTALDVTPWDAISLGNTDLTLYTKGRSGTFTTPMWPRTTLISDVHTHFAQGKRLRILYRARFTKTVMGFTSIYT